MTPEDDKRNAVLEATRIFDETRQREVGLSLGVAYFLGMTLVTTAHPDDDTVRQELTYGILAKLEVVIPGELIENGSEEFSGDLRTVVPVSLNQREVEHIGQSVLTTPTGRQIIEAFPINPPERAIREWHRNRQLQAFLSLSDEFGKAGGKTNPEIKMAVEE